MSPRPLGAASAACRADLIALGQRYHRFGWVLGTSGNLSGRPAASGDAGIVVTASGRHKGLLTPEDFVVCDLAGTVSEAGDGARPSAEAAIHLAIYRTRPTARSALHVHTVASTLLRPTQRGGTAECQVPHAAFGPGLEMIKGWGLWDEDAVAQLPIFDNHADVGRIADEIEAYLAAHPHAVPALVIAGHGITAWGESSDAANRHLEVTEFLCRVAVSRRSP